MDGRSEEQGGGQRPPPSSAGSGAVAPMTDLAWSWQFGADTLPRVSPLVAAQQLAEGRAARCEGAATPALRALEVRAVLTPAEREAAMLAAAGRSNREIASDLGLFVRTVENRMQRIYEKLAVSGRAELAAAMER